MTTSSTTCFHAVSILAPSRWWLFFLFQAEDGIRDLTVTGVQTCALPIFMPGLSLWHDQVMVLRQFAGGHAPYGPEVRAVGCKDPVIGRHEDRRARCGSEGHQLAVRRSRKDFPNARRPGI